MSNFSILPDKMDNRVIHDTVGFTNLIKVIIIAVIIIITIIIIIMKGLQLK